jgi:hypothetical protein
VHKNEKIQLGAFINSAHVPRLVENLELGWMTWHLFLAI